MKKYLLISAVLLSLCGERALAQGRENYPYWTISKDVQKLQFKNRRYKSSAIGISDVSVTSSKGVSQVHSRRTSEKGGQVTMTGMPSYVISKGNARRQFEKR